MKKTAENRYPHSATLFRFCKEALEIRYEGNVKVIDQDVGAILGYDPADCSHWKKGKKNIRALSTLRNIADHLSIDERLLIDIASGKIGLEEAVFEYKGYGQFAIKGQVLENLKKEFFKNPQKWQWGGSVRRFEELFNVDRPAVAKVAAAIIAAGDFDEAPIYLPEVSHLFPDFMLEATEDQLPVLEVQRRDDKKHTVVRYRGPDMRPYVRFLVAKELFKHLCDSGHEAAAKLAQAPEEVQDIQGNIFAGMLLVPNHLLSREVARIDSSLDIIQQLAETFWVSNALMNQRLSDYMENLN